MWGVEPGNEAMQNWLKITDQASVQTPSQQWMTKPLQVSRAPHTQTVFQFSDLE